MTDYHLLPHSPVSWDDRQIIAQPGIAPLILSTPSRAVATGLAVGKSLPVPAGGDLPILGRLRLRRGTLRFGIGEFGYRLRGVLRMYLPPNSALR